ncbi:MAG: hypothetical protein AAF547_14625 [Actinomycetota bacterium]
MAAESLQAACELAYAVAREDAESPYPAEPPSAMRSFLYVSDLPRRAITVAQQAVEDDSEFRSRVASRASEEHVGRAGYLWLHRPPGWASEFEELTNEMEAAADAAPQPSDPAPEPDPELEQVYNGLTVNSGPIGAVPDLPADHGSDFSFDPGSAFDTGGPPTADIPMATVSPISGTDEPLPVPPPPTYEPTALGTSAVTDRAEYDALETNFTAIGDADGAMLESTEDDFEADALENELSSLRGLVDRLAGERDQVLASLSPPETTVEETTSALGERVLESELMAMESDLESARHELVLAKDDLAVARSEREEAQRLHSETLKRQVDLEKELSSIREERMEIETQAAESQAQVLSLEEKLTRVTGQLEEADRERNVIRSQLETMTSERNHIRDDRAALRAERDEMSTRLAEIEEQSQGADIGELVANNRTLTSELETTSRELARMIAQAESFEEQIKSATGSVDTLKTEKIELTSRLSDTELALETTTTQHDALKADSERLAAEVGTLRAERDGLQTQLTELQASLADVLNEQAEVRQRNDADRKSLNELRVERDVLMARMGDLEQAERDYEVKLKGLVKERDDLVSARDDLIAERGQIRAEMTGVVGERDQTVERLNEVQSQIGPLETELQAERRQREELANRLLELDDIADQNAAELARLTGEREQLATAYQDLEARQLDAEAFKTERDSLAARVDEADRRLADVETQNGQKLAEMTEQLAAGESTRASLEQRLADAMGELDSLRLENHEVNQDVARLAVKVEDAERMAQAAEAGRLAEATRAAEAEEAAAAAAATVQAPDPLAAPAPLSAPSVMDDTAAAEPVAEDLTHTSGELPTFAGPPSLLDPDTDATSEAAAADAAADAAQNADTEAGAASPFGLVPGVGDGIGDIEVPNDITTMARIPDISQEVPVVELPPTGDGADATQVAEGFSWPAPDGDSDQPPTVLTADDLPDEDDLDEVSALIAKTVSGFSDDPSIPSIDAEDVPMPAGESPVPDPVPDDTTQVIPASSGPPSIFGARDDEDEQPAASGQPGSRRRQIEIPSDIMDDEVAVAQFVVSSPDVVLLVDGDAVAKLGWPSLLVAEQRDALVTYLADLSVSSGAAPDVVFDGRIGDDESLPASRAVRIRLSTPPTEPAAALDELVDAYPDQWPIALVTDDESLATSAGERGAAVLNNGQLLDLFIAQ